MGTRKFHVERSKHHRAAADYLSQKDEFLDWAVVALFYAAHETVHSVLSGDPLLPKDERHPRKHNAHGGAANGGRGTNQLVRARMSRGIYRDYMDLQEASHRTRYDMTELGRTYGEWLVLLNHIVEYANSINATRPDIASDAP